MCLCASVKKIYAYVLMCFCQKIYFMLMPKKAYVVMSEIWGYVLGMWDGDLLVLEPRGRGLRYIYGSGEIGLL